MTTEQFQEEYKELSKKYSMDYVALPMCDNKLLLFIIKLFGKRAKLSASIFINEIKAPEEKVAKI